MDRRAIRWAKRLKVPVILLIPSRIVLVNRASTDLLASEQKKNTP